ncbi:hypothetical protein BLOT_009167 [Blomia tropicalis]|nr:hypothetical protein BLOT_009167 [Blomia tropicalis]
MDDSIQENVLQIRNLSPSISYFDRDRVLYGLGAKTVHNYRHWSPNYSTSKRLKVEFLSLNETESRIVNCHSVCDSSLKKLTRADQSAALKSSSFNSDINLPFSSLESLNNNNLKYCFPSVSSSVIKRISKQLISNENFYHHVLLLMFKLNLHPPFDEDNIDDEETNINNKRVNNDLSSDESELDTKNSSSDHLPNSTFYHEPKKRKLKSLKVGFIGGSSTIDLIKSRSTQNESTTTTIEKVFDDCSIVPTHKSKSLNFDLKCLKNVDDDQQKEDPSFEEKSSNEFGIFKHVSETVSTKCQSITKKFVSFDLASLRPENLVSDLDLKENRLPKDDWDKYPLDNEQHLNSFDIVYMDKGRMRGQAFISFPSELMAEQALQRTNDKIQQFNYGYNLDQFEWMECFVKKYTSLLHSYGDFLLEKCCQHEKVHCKSLPKSFFHLKKASKLFWNHTKLQNLTENDYKQLFDHWKQSLLFMPINWNDWKLMFNLIEIYIQRAKIQIDQNNLKHASTDLRLASSILSRFGSNVQIKYRERSILLLMLSLMIAIVKKLNLSIENKINLQEIKMQIESCANNEPLFMTIQNISSALSQNDQSIDNLDLGENNYFLNKKVQLIIDNHEKSTNRAMIATDHIAKDEKLLIEHPQSTTMFKSHIYDHCNHCRREIVSFWPCSNCIEVVYCSVECSELAFDLYHKHECGIYGLVMFNDENVNSMAHVYRLLSFFGLNRLFQCEDQQFSDKFDIKSYFESNDLKKKSFKDFSTDDQNLLCQSVCSLLTHRREHEPYRENFITFRAVTLFYYLVYKGVVTRDLEDQHCIFGRLLEHLSNGMFRMCTNGFNWEISVDETTTMEQNSRVGNSLFLVSSLFNHSCESNLYWEIDHNGIIHMVAKHAIEPGNQLTICYGPTKNMDFYDRQMRLWRNYRFNCQCMLCMRDVANNSNTVRCIAPNGDCNGPLMLNGLNVCLKCGHRPATPVSEDLDRNIRQLSHSNNSFEWISRCIGGAKTMKRVGYKEFMKLIKYVDKSRLNYSRVVKLEKHFFIYSQLAYEGSYHLLEKCTLLLIVYQHMNCINRGIHLIGILERCLENIYPELIDSNSLMLVYILDYIGHFYHNLTILYNGELKNLFDDSKSDNPFQKWINTTNYWTFCIRLNVKLLNILKHDLENDGKLFSMENYEHKSIVWPTESILNINSNHFDIHARRLVASNLKSEHTIFGVRSP